MLRSSTKTQRRTAEFPTLTFRVLAFLQEIIKVREWIPHIGPLPKVIPLKLFLDMVPSSSEDVTRAMRGQSKRPSRNFIVEELGTMSNNNLRGITLEIRPLWETHSLNLIIYCLSPISHCLVGEIMRDLRIFKTSRNVLTEQRCRLQPE